MKSEHPNGEWTKYSHMRTGSTTAAGRYVGEPVCAGTYLGDEGDIGFAFGEHLHFEVAVPTNLTTPFDTLGGFINGYNLIPVVCDIPGNLYVAGQTYVAGPCGTDSCAPSIPLASQTVDGAQAYLASNDIEFNGDEFDILNTGSVVLKAGHHIRLGPGFRARPECYFEALIRDCNETPRLPQCLPLIIDR